MGPVIQDLIATSNSLVMILALLALAVVAARLWWDRPWHDRMGCTMGGLALFCLGWVLQRLPWAGVRFEHALGIENPSLLLTGYPLTLLTSTISFGIVAFGGILMVHPALKVWLGYGWGVKTGGGCLVIYASVFAALAWVRWVILT